MTVDLWCFLIRHFPRCFLKVLFYAWRMGYVSSRSSYVLNDLKNMSHSESHISDLTTPLLTRKWYPRKKKNPEFQNVWPICGQVLVTLISGIKCNLGQFFIYMYRQIWFYLETNLSNRIGMAGSECALNQMLILKILTIAAVSMWDGIMKTITLASSTYGICMQHLNMIFMFSTR